MFLFSVFLLTAISIISLLLGVKKIDNNGWFKKYNPFVYVAIFLIVTSGLTTYFLKRGDDKDLYIRLKEQRDHRIELQKQMSLNNAELLKLQKELASTKETLEISELNRKHSEQLLEDATANLHRILKQNTPLGEGYNVHFVTEEAWDFCSFISQVNLRREVAFKNRQPFNNQEDRPDVAFLYKYFSPENSEGLFDILVLLGPLDRGKAQVVLKGIWRGYTVEESYRPGASTQGYMNNRLEKKDAFFYPVTSNEFRIMHREGSYVSKDFALNEYSNAIPEAEWNQPARIVYYYNADVLKKDKERIRNEIKEKLKGIRSIILISNSSAERSFHIEVELVFETIQIDSNTVTVTYRYLKPEIKTIANPALPIKCTL